MSQPLEHVFLDMDGVLTDFVTAVVQLHGREELLANWPNGERDIPKILQLSRTEYWKVIDAQGAEFWASLKPFGWFSELVALVREFAPMTILSAPSLSPACLEGKVRWLYSHFPIEKGRRFTDYLIGSRKQLLAGPRRVLIDDADENVDKFRTAGGHAILFPQPWNANHAIVDRLDYVKRELQAICQGYGLPR